MGLISTALLYIRRKRTQTILISILLALVVFGECIGLLLYGTSLNAKEMAYIYNGTAILIEDDSLNLEREDMERIRQLEYVEGISNWREVVVTPTGTNNVKEHTGVTPTGEEETETEWYEEDEYGYEEEYEATGDDMVVLAQTDISLLDVFRWEKSVTVIDGEYADYENKGIMVESRYAAINGLTVGDSVAFYSSEFNRNVSLNICGIYKVDSDFEIFEENEEGTSVYIHSPYNTVYMEYYTAQEIFGFEPITTGCGVYVDEIEHIQAVADEIHALLGENVTVYDKTGNYLEDECRIVGLMQKMAILIVGMVFVLGFLMLLLVFSLFSQQYQDDTGRFLMLGQNKRWCIGRFAVITFAYMLIGTIAGMAGYMLSGNAISKLIGNVSMNVVANSQYVAVAGYNTPNFRQGFEVEVSMYALFDSSNLMLLAGILLLGWLITLLLPLHAVFITRPRTLLSNGE